MTDSPAAHRVQVVVDCLQPHILADWWAETLHWLVEPQDEAFIRSMIDQGFATDAETTIHRGALVWREGAAVNSPEGLRLLFQQVPEAKLTKNRLHLDIRAVGVSGEDLRPALLARGATKIGEGQQGPHSWWVMADPEGNEFCV